MTFHSPQYIFVFLPLVVAGFWLLARFQRPTLTRAWLLLASTLFFGWFDWNLPPMLAVSCAVNFALARAASPSANGQHKKALLVLGLIFNLGTLGVFKYSAFFIRSINTLFAESFDIFHLLLPLGISFITFQQIAYIVQASRGQLPKHGLLDYLLLIVFFPKLISGPIADPKRMLPQFTSAPATRTDWHLVAVGLFLFALGLVKKTLFGDTLSIIVSHGFDLSQSLGAAEAWISSLAYTFQLYFDFSGYTDMALGSGLMLGLKLPQNFLSPYKATSFRDFWRRWHITLSHWLRDYLYIPLGGNRQREVRTHINLMITFLLGGLWHGAAWTFVLWGAIHGLGNSVNRLWDKTGHKLPHVLAVLLTFLTVNLAWVPFRATSFADAGKVLGGMAGINGFGGLAAFEAISSLDKALAVCVAIFGAALIWLAPNSQELAERFTPGARTAAWTVAMLLLGLLFMNSTIPKEFLYFDF